MSTIFRASAADDAALPAAGPLVRGFVWSPGMWVAEPTAVFPPSPLPAPSPAAAQLQRQPDATSTVVSNYDGLSFDDGPSTMNVLPPVPAVTASPVEPPMPSQPASDEPEVSVMPTEVETGEVARPVSIPSAIQRQPAPSAIGASSAASSSSVEGSPSDVTPVEKTPPPSTLGRIWQRLGGLVSRPQPPTASPQPAPMPRNLATAVSASEAVASKPETVATIHASEAVSLPEPLAAQTTIQRQPASVGSEVSMAVQPPILSTAAPEQIPEIPQMPDAPQMPNAPQTPDVSPLEMPVRAPFSAGPVTSTAVPSPATPSIQRTPDVPVTPTAVPMPSLPPAVPTPPATPLAQVQRQPVTTSQPPPVLPATPAGTVPAAVLPPAVPAMQPATSMPPLTVPTTQPAQPMMTPPAVVQPTAIQPTAVQPTAIQPTAVQRQPESSPSQSEEDRNWRRLETIMRRHQERQAAEEAVGATAGTTTESGAAGSTPQPPAASSAVTLPSFAKPPVTTPKPSPGTVSRQPAPPPREAPMVAVARGRGTAVPPTSPSMPVPPTESIPGESERAVGVQSAERLLATTQPAPTLAEPTRTDGFVSAAQPDRPGSKQEIAEDTLLAGSQMSEPPPAASLETVWPVQTVQRMETTPTASPGSGASTERLPVPTELPVRPPTPQDFWVQERIAAVPPGMPTDSSVPLLRPRRPRPGRMEQPTAAVMASPVQADGMDTAASLAPSSTAIAIQRQPETAGGLVPTEIGDLPPDLWTLIGQPAPAVSAPERTSVDGGKTVMAKREEVGVSASDMPTPEASSPSAPDLSDYIQREPTEGDETSGGTAVAPTEGGEETGEKKEGEEIDINELARQVYAHIRGQLAIDRERERGKLMHKW